MDDCCFGLSIFERLHKIFISAIFLKLRLLLGYFHQLSFWCVDRIVDPLLFHARQFHLLIQSLGVRTRINQHHIFFLNIESVLS